MHVKPGTWEAEAKAPTPRFNTGTMAEPQVRRQKGTMDSLNQRTLI